MKENSSMWNLLAKRTDHSLSKEEAEALEQMLKEDTSLQRASQLVDDSLVNMDTRQVEEVMNRTWSKVESGMKANRKPRLKFDYPSLCRGSQYCCPMCVGWCIGLSALG